MEAGADLQANSGAGSSESAAAAAGTAAPKVAQLTQEQMESMRSNEPKLDQIIAKLTNKNNLTVAKLDINPLLSYGEIDFLIKEARKYVVNQPLVLNLDAPIKIFGDIHGQYLDLLRWFEKLNNEIEYTLFLGDYVDRGKNSIEVICLLLACKCKFPLTFFLLRGNHETAPINRIYGFYDEVKRRYAKDNGTKLYKAFSDFFNRLPVAAIIADKIFACHGGLPNDPDFLQTINKLVRPFDVPEYGPITDLLWADPDMSVTGFAKNDRGVSYVYGPDVLKAFMDKHGFDLFVRAHQVCEDGFEFHYKQKGVTIFSAPNYCGEFDNAGAVMVVSELLECSFKILTAQPREAARISYHVPTYAQLKDLEEQMVEKSSKSS